MKNYITKDNFWVMVCIMFFGVTKIVALICAAVIAVKANIWIGAILFLVAIVFRITWTFTPTVDEMKKIKGEE